MAITIPPVLVDYVIFYAALVVLRPPGLFFPDGRPRNWGTGPEDTAIPAWFVALAATLRFTSS